MSAVNINKSNFLSEVIHSDKPVLMDFWAPWCGRAVWWGRLWRKFPENAAISRCAKSTWTSSRELAGQFGVMSIPTLVVMKNGKIVNQSIGAKPKNAILAML